MRMLIFWLFFMLATPAVAQWIPLQTGIPGKLTDLYFADAQNGYIVGDQGIYRTTDGGNNWTLASFEDGTPEQAVYARTVFRAVFICPSICNKGYAIGQDTLLQQGVCFETSDQGASWQLLAPVANPPPSWNDLVVVNNTIFMGGDGGRFIVKHPFNPNWTEANTPPLGDIKSVWFSGASPGGLAATSQGLYYTADVGANWVQVFNIPMTDMVSGFSKGFAVGGQQVYRASPPTSQSSWPVAFELPDSVLISAIAIRGFNIDAASIGSNKGVYKRIIDEVWELQPSSQAYPIHALFFVNANTGFAISNNGILLKTENAGGPTLPYVDFDYQTSGCIGDTVIFKHKGHSGNTYQWSVNGELIPGASDSLVWHFDTPGTYHITLTGSNADLSNTYSRQLIITPFPDTTLQVYAQQDTLCEGGDIFVVIENSQNDVSYTLYQQPGNEPIDTINGTGQTSMLYGGVAQADAQFAISAQNNLSGCNTWFNQIIAVAVAVPTDGQSMPPMTICAGDSVQLTARPGLAYEWHPAEFVSHPAIVNPLAFPVDTSTLFTVRVQIPYCPAFTDSIVINISFPIQPEILLSGDSLYALPAGAVLYEWYHNEQLITESIGPVLPLQGEGSYFVVLTDSIGCRSETSPVIIVLIDTELPAGSQVEVFPNPSDGMVIFVFKNKKTPRRLRFYDAQGRLCYSVNWSRGLHRQEITLPASFPSGNFYWKAEGDGWQVTGKGVLK